MESPTNKKELNKENKWAGWEKTRAKSTFHFVIVHGCLFWGGFMGIFMLIFQYFRSSDSYLKEVVFEPSNLALHFFGSFIGGFVWGIFVWFFSESANQRSRRNKDFNIWIPKQKTT